MSIMSQRWFLTELDPLKSKIIKRKSQRCWINFDTNQKITCVSKFCYNDNKKRVQPSTFAIRSTTVRASSNFWLVLGGSLSISLRRKCSSTALSRSSHWDQTGQVCPGKWRHALPLLAIVSLELADKIFPSSSRVLLIY